MLIFILHISSAICLVLSVWMIVNIVKVLYGVVYEANLLICHNEQVLLIYNRNSGRLGLPKKRLPYDEVPTETISQYLSESFNISKSDFCYSARYHGELSKFARIRDSYGPVYITDIKTKVGKLVRMYYVLELDRKLFSGEESYPYPEFYSKREIEMMDGDTCPSEEELDIIYKIIA